MAALSAPQQSRSPQRPSCAACCSTPAAPSSSRSSLAPASVSARGGPAGVGGAAAATATAAAAWGDGDGRRPALRFGAIADVQYADVDDAWNFRRTQVRRYRGALDSLRLAVDDWCKDPTLDFVADLGDIIDQQCESRGDAHEALARVLQEWTPLTVPVFHLIGNHELYNFNRAECAELIPNATPWYRSFQPAAGWRVVILDPYDLNMIERGGGPSVEEGIEYLSQRNPNDLRAPRGSVDLTTGLVGMDLRFVPMAGAVRGEQLAWLRNELQAAERCSERVIVLTHVPVHPDSSVPAGLLWNYDEVLEVLRSAGEGTVALVLAGHFHPGGGAIDAESGTHHITLPSPLNADPKDPRAHCRVEVWNDRVVIVGSGLVPSRILPLRPRHWPARPAPAFSAHVQARL